MSKIVSYIQEVNKETRKVSWPSRKELIDNTALTLFASLFVALVIFGEDQIISRILQFIYALL